MFLNAIIFRKLQNVFSQLGNQQASCFQTFTPVATVFTNEDFNFLDTTLPANQLSESFENQMAFTFLANGIVRNDKIYSLLPDEFLQNAYKRIFENAILIDGSLSDADKQLYVDARKLLFEDESLEPTAAYKKYLSFRDRYSECTNQLSAMTEKVADNPSDEESKREQEALLTQQGVLLNDWQINGQKESIERALKSVKVSNARSAFISQWNEEYKWLQTKLQKLTTINSNIDFLPATCLPKDLFRYDYHGWTKMVLEESEINALEIEAKNTLGETFYNAQSSSLAFSKIEFEYLFVTILRNWFKPELINSSFWTFPDSSMQPVSDEQGLTNGLMPSYIDKFMFIRRICSYNKDTHEENNSTPAALDLNSYRFKDIAGLKKVNDLKAIVPINRPAMRYRLLDAGNTPIRPIFKNQIAANLEPKMDVQAKLLRASNDNIRFSSINPASETFKPILVTGLFMQGPAGNEAPKTTATLNLTFKDNLNTVITGVTVSVTNKNDGSSYSMETSGTGTVVLPSLKKDDYNIEIRNEEMYEDTSCSIRLDNDMQKEIALQRRTNPRFDMLLIGTINCRFPKLPNPLPGYSYS
ncbi:MAG: carboxypeptidase regulatory-like domain-containing protein [Chitinophaga sp.]|uniref:carboxypeptidase-like regulatory domain-containing protein n=1 Tax=Chitinophaga sp. TaxID=1869181 RepID=UPI0025C390A3|nr:carboxypeptidase-like regulatory domain-containing protein [Chitinophaga sp.]MBV8251384.1 carboxypeptidase regulatory-like domain-containing protein [Chitinophaga sp.]